MLGGVSVTRATVRVAETRGRDTPLPSRP
jgi:hypothetical protein